MGSFRSRRSWVAVLAVALLFAACGGSREEPALPSGGGEGGGVNNGAANNGASSSGGASTGGVNGASGSGADEKRWKPTPGTTWQWQLAGAIDTSLDVQVYDVDLFTTSKATIDQLHAKGRKVVCYFSAGSWEPDRPDSNQIPEKARGKKMKGWPKERWLDIRDPAVRTIMVARLDVAKTKGCDAVEPDNVDGFEQDNDAGFPLVPGDQIAFNRLLAEGAHARGMSVALKNDLAQVDKLVKDFDFALNEECFEQNECELLLPFIRANKAVFNVEYVKHQADASNLKASICPKANQMNFDSLIKVKDLDAFRLACR